MGAAAGGFLRSPNRTRLSAAATIASSFGRGAQPSSCRAFALLAFLSLPSSGRNSRAGRLRNAAMRTSQSGSSRVETRAATAGRRLLSTWAMPASDMDSPPRPMKRSPRAAGFVMARRCRSATSRTSTTPKYNRGRPGMPPSSMVFKIRIEVE
jgi:hypothetical protein